MRKRTSKTGNTKYRNRRCEITHVPGGAKHFKYTKKDGTTKTTRTPGRNG